MVVSNDLKWRAIVLTFLYDILATTVATVLGVSIRSICRWYKNFKENGNVCDDTQQNKRSKWPNETIDYVKQYILEHPCFYLEEMQHELKKRFPTLKNTSSSTICRVLKFDLHMSRKILSKRAREAKAFEIQCFYKKILPF